MNRWLSSDCERWRLRRETLWILRVVFWVFVGGTLAVAIGRAM